MVHITISSLVGNPIRKISMPGFASTFIIAQKSTESNYIYSVLEESSMVILIEAVSLSSAIDILNRFLEHKKQSDLNLIIEKIQLNLN